MSEVSKCFELSGWQSRAKVSLPEMQTSGSVQFDPVPPPAPVNSGTKSLSPRIAVLLSAAVACLLCGIFLGMYIERVRVSFTPGFPCAPSGKKKPMTLKEANELVIGQTTDEVLKRLGAPSNAIGFHDSRTLWWLYDGLIQESGKDLRGATVEFHGDRVVKVF
jgi:hypothetical protein